MQKRRYFCNIIIKNMVLYTTLFEYLFWTPVNPLSCFHCKPAMTGCLSSFHPIFIFLISLSFSLSFFVNPYSKLLECHGHIVAPSGQVVVILSEHTFRFKSIWDPFLTPFLKSITKWSLHIFQIVSILP